MPLIGCHISIDGGIELAPGRGRSLGCDCMQIFTANQMQWKGASISPESRDLFSEGLIKNKIRSVVSHDSYLINLSSPESVKLAMSRKAFVEEIQRCTLLKIPHLVFHPGSHMGKGDDYALQKIAESLDYCLVKVPNSTVTLLLEITAGQGTNVGFSFEQLQTILDQSSQPKRLGVCFDTCHAYAAGYDIITESGYRDTFKEFDDIIGLEHLRVFHLNDSTKSLGSRIDRHSQIGKGFIGVEPFIRLINDERFAELPMILETPGEDEHYAREIQLLKEAIAQ
jgi:deoxyribonuclease-4